MKSWKTVKKDGVEFLVLPAIDRERHELPSTAYGAEVEHDKDGRPISVALPEDYAVPFAPAGKEVAFKRLYTIKAVKPDGTLVQIPFEDQINNNVASPENAIGLRGYQRKGFHILFDFETHEGAMCPTWDCWAKWDSKLHGFCSEKHMAITKPKDDAAGSRFGQNATTSASW
jgi:hypothetical protein